MKRFRAKFNPKRKGVYAVSLVDEPAMEGDFIQFAKENPLKFASVDEDKRRVMGLILEPDKDILRFDAETDTQYTVRFEKQDIEDVAYNFQIQGNQNNSTIQHQGKAIEDVSFVETWIVENPKVDKSTNFGFEYPKGSWMGVMQLNNEEIWNDYVKTGKVKGFSIDALMEFEEINLNKLNMDVKNEGNILDFLKDLPNKIALAMKPKEVEVEEKKVELADEVKEDKKKVELEHDGKEHEDEDKKVKLEEEEEVKEEVKAEFNPDEFLKSLIEKLQSMMEPTEVSLAKLEKDVLEFKTENETLKEKNLELSKLPATKSVKAAPRQISFSEMSNYEKFQYNKDN